VAEIQIQELQEVVTTQNETGFLPDNKTKTKETAKPKQKKISGEDEGYTYFSKENPDISVSLKRNGTKVSNILKFYE